MKKFVLILTFVFIGSSIAVAQKGAKGTVKPDPSKGVRDAFDRITEGIKQVDANKLMSVYDNNERTLFFNNNGSVTLGWKQMKENRVSSFAKIKNVTLETKGVRVEMLSPMSAYVSFTWKQTQEHEGKLENSSGRTTLIFKLIGKDWKAVHVHSSPDDPSPNRPVFDSEREKPATK